MVKKRKKSISSYPSVPVSDVFQRFMVHESPAVLILVW